MAQSSEIEDHIVGANAEGEAARRFGLITAVPIWKRSKVDQEKFGTRRALVRAITYPILSDWGGRQPGVRRRSFRIAKAKRLMEARGMSGKCRRGDLLRMIS